MVQGALKDTTVCAVGLGTSLGNPCRCVLAVPHNDRYDLDAKKIAQINARPGNKVLATTDPARIAEADVVIIATPTLVTKAKDPDISYVVSAAETVGQKVSKTAPLTPACPSMSMNPWF